MDGVDRLTRYDSVHGTILTYADSEVETGETYRYRIRSNNQGPRSERVDIDIPEADDPKQPLDDSEEAEEDGSGIVPRQASNDATLSGLTVVAKDGNALALDPVFSSTVTTYTAVVANGSDQATVTPTVNNAAASFDIQDSANDSIADADSDSANGHQVPLNVGENVINVLVTAEDSNTTQTYTVTVTRVGSPVVLYQTSARTANSGTVGKPQGGQEQRGAQKFRTGSSSAGYAISRISFYINEATGSDTATVTIYSAGADGRPDSALFAQSTTDIAHAVNRHVDTPQNAILEPETDYFIVFGRTGTGNQGYLISRATSHTASNAAPGWSYDRWHRKIGAGAWDRRGSITIFATIHGTAIPEEIAPTLVSAEVDGTELVLTYDEHLKTSSTPSTSAFEVSVDGTPLLTVSMVRISGKTVRLTLAEPVFGTDTVTVSYTVPAGNSLQDALGNEVAALTDQPVTNNTPAASTLVSNLSSVDASERLTVGGAVGSKALVAQKFTTGSSAAGYTLNTVKFSAGADAAGVFPKISLVEADADGDPGTEVYELEGTLLANGDVTFRAAAEATPTVLRADT